MDQHELLTKVKDLALELGRTPTRAEFSAQVRGGSYQIEKLFRNYSLLLQAAGLETYQERQFKQKQTFTRESVFGADISEAIAAHTPREVQSHSESFEPILAIGDTHFPFAHQKTLEKVYRFAEKHQPKHIVQLGDLMDQFSHSRFPASRNYYKPDEEMALARSQAETFWKEIQKAAPKAKCYQIMGNHDVRALKLILNAAPTLESVISKYIETLYHFEGVQTVTDYREELIIQGVMFHHGYMGRHGQQRDFVLNNLVSGHTHRGAVVYRALKDRTIWHLDAGYLGDAESKALSYTAQKVTGWTLGWGFVDEYGPRFIPM